MWILENTVEALAAMNKEVETCAKYLASAAVDIIVYACTAGSFLEGVAFDEKVKRRISEASGGTLAVPTSSAVIEALRLLGLRKLSVATPYTPEVNVRLQAFLEGNGFQVLNLAGKRHVNSREIGDDLPEAIVEFARENFSPKADGMLLSCTNWRAMEVIGELEKELGRPVVTSNQATIWATFRALQLNPHTGGCGTSLGKLGTLASVKA
jgi:maleate isomerase